MLSRATLNHRDYHGPQRTAWVTDRQVSKPDMTYLFTVLIATFCVALKWNIYKFKISDPCG